MDGDTAELILDLLKTQGKDIKDLSKAISEINGALVGRVACENFRREIWDEIDSLKKICQTFETLQPKFIDTTTLGEAKQEVLSIMKDDTKLDIQEMKAEIKLMRDQLSVLSFTWGTIRSNKALLVSVLWGISVLIGVYYGRAVDVFDFVERFGWERTIIDIAIVFGTLVLIAGVTWLVLNRGRAKERIMLWFS